MEPVLHSKFPWQFWDVCTESHVGGQQEGQFAGEPQTDGNADAVR